MPFSSDRSSRQVKSETSTAQARSTVHVALPVFLECVRGSPPVCSMSRLEPSSALRPLRVRVSMGMGVKYVGVG